MDRIADLLRHGYRFGPALPTPRTRAGLPEGEMRGASLPTTAEMLVDYGSMPAKIATEVAMQPVRAGEAVGEAVMDPSIANVTNAGVQTAFAVAKPVHALKALGAGYVAAAGKDAGLDEIIGSAMAQSKGKKAPALKGTVQDDVTPPPEDDPLDPSQRQRLTVLQTKQAKGEKLSLAERQEQNTYLQTLQTAASAKATEKARVESDAKRAERAEYDRSVMKAEDAFTAEKAKDKSFKDSDVGKVYDKTGGYLPMMLAGAGGVLRATAKGVPASFKDAAITGAEGTGLAFSAMNAPLVYDAFSTPVKNPTREAMLAYASALPPGHPRKEEFMNLARTEDPLNPVNKRAWDELTSLSGQGRRLFSAAVEGVPSALTGALLPSAAKETIKGVAGVPGLIREGNQVAQGRAAAAKSQRYGAEAEAGAKRALAADNRVLALEAEAAAAEAQRRLAGQKAGAVQPAPPGQAQPAPPVAPPPQPAVVANPPPALPPPAVPPAVVAPPVGGQQAPVPVGPPPPPPPPAKSTVPSNAGQQPSKSAPASGPRYTQAHSSLMEDQFTSALKTKPGPIQPNEKEAARWAADTQKLFASKGMDVPSTENLVKRFMGSATVLKFLQSQGADITDPNVVRLAFRRGNETLGIGVGMGAAAASQYEDDTSPTGYRDESGRFAKGGSSLDDAISKAMGGAP